MTTYGSWFSPFAMGSTGKNSGHQSWHQAPLLTGLCQEPSCVFMLGENLIGDVLGNIVIGLLVLVWVLYA